MKHEAAMMTLGSMAVARRSALCLRCEMVTDLARLEALAEPWDELWQAGPRPDIFTTFAWVRACLDIPSPRRTPCVPVIFKGDRLVGLLPVALEGRILKFIGHGYSDYNDFLSDGTETAAALELALRTLLDSGLNWKGCVLENLPETSHFLAVCSSLAANFGPRLTFQPVGVCPALVLAGDRHALLGEALKKGKTKYYQNRLRKLGKLTFRHLEDREEVRAHIPDFFRQYLARRTMSGDTELTRHAWLLALCESLVERVDPCTLLRFAILELAGRPIAYHLGFESHGRLVYYKPTFDLNHWDNSPGQVLLRELLEYCGDRGIDEFDFSVGDEDYKSRYANCARTNYTARLFPTTSRARAFRLGQGVRECLRRWPRLESMLRWADSERKGLVATLRRGLSRHGAVGVGRRIFTNVFRASVYARDEVLVYSIDHRLPVTGRRLVRLPDGIVIELGTLASLADLAGDYPDVFNTARLHDFRERLRRGDRLFIALDKQTVVHASWVGIRSEIVATHESGADCKIVLDEPGAVIYDCWTAPFARGRSIYPAVLCELMERGLRDCQSVWIYCLSGNDKSRRGIEKTGFRLSFRFIRTRFLRRGERSQVCASIADS